MKQITYFILLAMFIIAFAGCDDKKIDYEHLSKEELIELDEKGDEEATLQLGRLAIHEMKMDEAKEYFSKSAENNNPKGLHNLALINITQRNMDEGVAKLEKAISLGFEPSKGVLAAILVSNPNKSRYDEGVRLAEAAAKKGDKFGYFALASHLVQQGHKNITEGDEVDTYFLKSIEAGSSMGVYVYVITMLNGGYTADEVIEKIKPYQSKFPKVVGDLIATCKGDRTVLATPYYNDGYQGIEDMME